MANFNFNKVILGGRLTATPENKQTQNGISVCQFSIAVNRRGKDQPADFINCVAYRERADLICKYFSKGSSICVVGEIQTRLWKDKEGNNRYATEVIVNEVSFVDSKNDAQGSTASYKPSQSENMTDVDDGLPF